MVFNIWPRLFLYSIATCGNDKISLQKRSLLFTVIMLTGVLRAYIYKFSLRDNGKAICCQLTRPGMKQIGLAVGYQLNKTREPELVRV